MIKIDGMQDPSSLAYNVFVFDETDSGRFYYAVKEEGRLERSSIAKQDGQRAEPTISIPANMQSQGFFRDLAETLARMGFFPTETARHAGRDEALAVERKEELLKLQAVYKGFVDRMFDLVSNAHDVAMRPFEEDER